MTVEAVYTPPVTPMGTITLTMDEDAAWWLLAVVACTNGVHCNEAGSRIYRALNEAFDNDRCPAPKFRDGFGNAVRIDLVDHRLDPPLPPTR